MKTDREQEYQLRAQAAVLVLLRHGLEGEYLAKYEELKAKPANKHTQPAVVER